jgi:hypothetical protein
MIAWESVVLAGGQEGEVARRLTLGSRAGALPLAAQGYPTARVGREWKQRFEGGVDFQRDYDQPRAVHSLWELLSNFGLINHIQFSSVQFRNFSQKLVH